MKEFITTTLIEGQAFEAQRIAADSEQEAASIASALGIQVAGELLYEISQEPL